MAVLENIVIELKAQGAQVQAGLAQVENRLKQFESSTVGRVARIEGNFKRLSAVGGLITKAFAVVGSAAALGGVTRMVKSSLEAADTIGDTAIKLGLSSTALQEYTYAARLSGVSAEEFNTAVTRLNQTLAATALKPDSTVGRLFQQWGIDAREAQTNVESALTRILGKIGEIPNAAQRALVIKDIFGRGGANLAILAAEGADGIARLRAQLGERGGIIPSEIIANAGRLNDEWDAMSTIIKSQLAVAFIQLAPLMITALSNINNLIVGVTNLAKAFGLMAVDNPATQALLAQETMAANMEARLNKMRQRVKRGESVAPGAIANLEKQLTEVERQIETARAAARPAAAPTAAAAVDLPGADGKAGRGRREQLSDQQRAIQQVQEQINELRVRNIILQDAARANLTLADTEQRVLAAETAWRTGSLALGTELAGLTQRTEALSDAIRQQGELREQFAATQRLAPQRAALLEQARTGQIQLEDLQPLLALAEKQDELRQIFTRAGYSQEQIDSVLAMAAAVDAVNRSQERQTQAVSFVSERGRELTQQTETLQLQRQIFVEGLTSGKRYVDVQRDMADAAERLRLRHEGLRLGATAEDLASLDAALRRHQALARQFEEEQRRVEEMGRVAEDVADRIAGSFTDMLREGEFSFQRLHDTFLDLWADITYEILRNSLANALQQSMGIPSGGGENVLMSWFAQTGTRLAGGTPVLGTAPPIAAPGLPGVPAPYTPPTNLSGFTLQAARTPAAGPDLLSSLPAAGGLLPQPSCCVEAVQTLEQTGEGLLSGLNETGSSVLDRLGGLGSGLLSSIGSLGGSLLNGISGLLGSAGSGLSSLLGSAVSFLGFQEGGRVPGTGPYPILAHGGELIVPAPVTRHLLTRPDQVGAMARAVAAHQPVPHGAASSEQSAVEHLQPPPLTVYGSQQTPHRRAPLPAFQHGGLVPGAGPRPIIAHGSEAVATAVAVRETGGNLSHLVANTDESTAVLKDIREGQTTMESSMTSAITGLGGGLMGLLVSGAGGSQGMAGALGGGLGLLFESGKQGAGMTIAGIPGLIGSLFFQHGGIVPGPPSLPVPIVAHGGELVLNRAQQSALAQAPSSQDILLSGHMPGEERMHDLARRVAGEGPATRSVTINMQINTPDASSFRRSQTQIAAETRMAVERAHRRNN